MEVELLSGSYLVLLILIDLIFVKYSCIGWRGQSYFMFYIIFLWDCHPLVPNNKTVSAERLFVRIKSDKEGIHISLTNIQRKKQSKTRSLEKLKQSLEIWLIILQSVSCIDIFLPYLYRGFFKLIGPRGEGRNYPHPLWNPPWLFTAVKIYKWQESFSL